MEAQQYIFMIGIGGVLLACAIMDIINKKVSLVILGITFVVLLIAFPFQKEVSYGEGLGGFFVGIMLLGINKVTRGQIGTGDAFLFCVTGIYLGIWNNLSLLLYSLVFAAIFSVMLIVVKKVGKKYTIPFVPFVFMGFMGVLML